MALSDADKLTLLRTARQTLEDHLDDGRAPNCETDNPALLEHRATFVTLRQHETGDLRGCRGETVARQPLIESVAHMAIASATDDPRFPPVALGEVPSLHIEISALTPLAPIEAEDVEVGRHGLLISRDQHSGLLLPQVPVDHGWNKDEFLDWVCRKAGLPDGAWRSTDADLYGFECEIWEEDEGPEARTP
jgi:AmmeMemoRadiSam system protein A